jgi:hypothetical protein
MSEALARARSIDRKANIARFLWAAIWAVIFVLATAAAHHPK